MSALTARVPAAAGALSTGRVTRSAVRPLAVAVPRRAAAPRSTATPAAAVASPVTAAATIEAPAAGSPAKAVHLITADVYYDFLSTHSDKLVVVDYYAVWCGPCKMIAPELDRMAAEGDTSKLVFAKIDCGATNESKKLAMSLGIKALPTFHLYRENKIVDSMTGAKVKALQDLINKHL